MWARGWEGGSGGGGGTEAPPSVAVLQSLYGSVLIPADSSSLFNPNHSPLCGCQALVDTALESPASALPNAVTTSTWKLHSGEWVAFKSELESEGLSTRPLTRAGVPFRTY